MISENNSSESESSDDDNLAHLREAADPDLINDRMFQSAGKKTNADQTDDAKPATVHKSQRYIADGNEHIDDMLIPEAVQKFVSKKLAKIIENRVQFVDVRVNAETNTQTSNVPEQIKLLDNVVLQIDWAASDTTQHGKRKKPKIKRRIVDDVDTSKTELMRLREAVIGLEEVSKEVNNWRTKPKRTLFEYHEKNGRLFEAEPKTEFSEKRKKNNWDESKISRNKNCLK